MEAAGVGISSLLQSTKTKLLVLSSLLGVGTIYYLTRNYLRSGQFFPAQTTEKVCQSIEGPSRHPKVIGGKRVSINEDAVIRNGETSKVFGKQRSRRSSISSQTSKSSTRNAYTAFSGETSNVFGKQRSRRSSVASKLSKSSTKNTTTISSETKTVSQDVALKNAISELDSSIHEIEEILQIHHNHSLTPVPPLNGNIYHNIENEITRLRRLISYAQDSDTDISKKTQEFLSNKGKEHYIRDDLAEVSTVTELNNENYEELVKYLRNQKELEDSSYDSDAESFISAAESVEYEIGDDDYSQDSLYFKESIKDAVLKHNKKDFYMQGIEYLTQYGVPVRSVRTHVLKCDNDIDFCVKVHCLRTAFKDLLQNDECRDWFVSSGKDMISSLLTKTNHDSVKFAKSFDEIIRFCKNSENWRIIEEELNGRGVCCINFYDIVLDFMIMDAFEDLSNPPASVLSAVRNKWLSLRIKETALSTAIWTVIKGKKRMLKYSDGFASRFYDVTMQVTPMLAWGFLGPVRELNELCNGFKNSLVGFLQDIFSTEKANYKTVQTLSDDIYELAKKRKDELMALVT